MNVEIKRYFNEFFLLAFGMAFFSGASFLANVFSAKILGPEIFGIWNFLYLFIIYGSFLHLGVLNGMGRQIPYYIGDKKPEIVEKIKKISFVVVVGAGIFFFLCSVVSIFFIKTNYLIKICLPLTGLLFLTSEIQAYTRMYLRSILDFKALSKQFIASGFFLMMLIYPLVKLFSLPGLILAQIFSFGIATILFLNPPKIDLALLSEKEISYPLIKIGFPIMMAGYLYMLLTSLDRWIIAGYLGTKQLGYYSLVIITLGVITLLPRVISTLIYPRMVKEFGHTRDERNLVCYVKKQFLGSYVVAIPLFLLFYLLFPSFVKKFMPAYIPGIEAMKIVLWGTLFLPLGSSFGDFLNTTGRQNYYLSVQAISVAINFILTYTFVTKMDMGIQGAALGTAITYFFYSICLAFISWRLVLAKIWTLY